MLNHALKIVYLFMLLNSSVIYAQTPSTSDEVKGNPIMDKWIKLCNEDPKACEAVREKVKEAEKKKLK